MTFTARAAVINSPFIPAGHLPAVAQLMANAERTHAGYLTITLALPKRPRTTGERSQNNHAWGHITQLAEETGHEVSEIEYIAKMRAVRRGYPIDVIAGEAVPRSQARITTEECAALIDELHQIAAELEVPLIEE